MVPQSSLLICLLHLMDCIPLPATPMRRGRPAVHSERLFLKALVVMIVRRLPSVHALLVVLDQPEMAAVRALLSEQGCHPTRRTWERPLKALVNLWPRVTAVDHASLAPQHAQMRR